MALKLPIPFPSEAEQLRQRARQVRDLTVEERFAAVAEALAVADALSQAGPCRQKQLEYEAQSRQEWRDRMKEFIASHVTRSPPTVE